jgi:molybdopterin-guanine dinucleotide biosynthesis protein A
MGGSKATVELCGRPLLSYPLQSLREVLGEVAIVAKPDTELPSLPGVTVWIEPPAPSHPLIGLVHALALAEHRPVLVCAGDLPFVPPALVARLATTDPQRAPAVVVACGEQIQPLLGCYQQRSLALLGPAARAAEEPVREAVAAIAPRLLQVEDREVLFNVNAPEDLLQAAAILDRRRRAARAPS